MLAEVGAVLLAAGRGERLRPLTETVPKAALPVLDVPLGAFGLAALLDAALSVAVNVSHLAAEAVAALAPWGRATFLVEPAQPFGTAGTLAALRRRVGPRIVTHNADLLSDIDPAAVVAAHAASGAPATVTAVPVAAGADFVVEGDAVARFVDRRSDDVEGWRFAGVAVLERAVLDMIGDARPLGLAEAILRPLASTGELGCFRHHGYACDVGTPGRYLAATLDIVAGRAPAGIRVPGRIDRGRYLGPGTAAAPGTLRRGAVVLGGAEVRPGAVVEEAIVWPGEVVPEGAVVHRAIFAAGRVLEAGRA